MQDYEVSRVNHKPGKGGYLAHQKQRLSKTLQQDYAYDPMAVLGGGAVSYERGTPVKWWMGLSRGAQAGNLLSLMRVRNLLSLMRARNLLSLIRARNL